MADIRTTGPLDDFQRADENPVASPWVKADSAAWAGGMRLSSHHLIPSGAGDSKWAWTGESFSGDIEIWGQTWDVPDLSEGWRMAILEDVGSTSACDGYSMRVTYGAGANSLTINRLSNGAFTLLASDSDIGTPANEYMMMRLTATDVEVWFGDTTATSWEKILSVGDTTYRSGLYGCLGVSSDEGSGPGWELFGGGATVIRNRGQFFRYVSN